MDNYIFRQLDKSYLEKAAKCLAETFVGVKKSHYIIEEPMINATNLTVDEFQEFCKSYLESTYHQGFHFIAIDKETDDVVGVIGTDIFDATQEEEPFEGSLEEINRIIETLEPLDILLVEKFEHVIQRNIKIGDLLHGFLIGVQIPQNKRFIAKKLVEMVLEKGKEEGLKGFFVEATNPRSQKLVKQEFGAYVPTDINGKSIMVDYKDDPFFHVIPSEISENLQILYIPIDSSINLR